MLIVVTFGIWLAVLLIWGAIALGVHIRRRYGKRGMWIYVGAWCIAAALGALFPNDPPPPTHTPPITVTVTVTSGAAP